MNKTYFLLMAICFSVLTLSLNAQITVTSQISSTNDDAEEQGLNGSSPGTMDLTSSDIELVVDGGDGNQFVGMRFTNINVPQGAFITNAYIQFTVDETDSDSCSLIFKVEDDLNPANYSGTSGNISSRNLMAGSVLWENLAAWNTVGAAGPDQQTPDLAQLVQAMIDQSGWVSGNAINFIVTGVGSRTAEAYDGTSSSAPVLTIEYAIPTQLIVQVNSSSDDAEERGLNTTNTPGVIDLTSSDLELVKDGGDGNQFVGIRFTNVNVDQGTTIASAYIQFTVDETELDSTSVWITAEDNPNPGTFTSTLYDISNRSTINDSVLWENIPLWPSSGVSGPDQRTSNIGSLVQALVNQGSWTPGNAMSFIITGVGQRTAESYDGSASQAPQLIINYVTQTAPLGTFPLDSGTIWAYDDNGTALPTTWVDSNYNDSAWAFGPAELGYGDGGESTVLDFGPDANNKYPTYYFRQKFESVNSAQWDSLRLFLKYDDGAVVYLNGTEVYRVNMPTGAIAYSTLANAAIGGAAETQFTEVMLGNFLIEGINTIAVEMHQNAVTSSDLSFDLRLEGVLPPIAVDTFPLAAGLDWYYLDNGSNQDTAWREFSFNPFAEGWAQGQAQLGYGDGDEATVIGFGPDQGNKYITSYFYKEFFIDTVGVGDSLRLYLLRDDAAAVYLNGNLVVLDNMTAPYDYTTWSNTTVAGADESTFFTYDLPTAMFNNGLNSIAVEIHQRDNTSSDKSFDLKLNIKPEDPIAGSGCTNGILNHIGCFTSIDNIGQTPFLTIPESHAFQVVSQQGDAYDNFGGVAPGNHDFTGYVAVNGSSTQGYVAINHETSPGGVSVLDVHYDEPNRVWVTDSNNRVDMYTTNQVTTSRNCSGGITPWGTTISSEETYNTGDANTDGYIDVGWNVEIDPVTRQVVNDTKLWALGRMAHENVVVANDSVTVYQGEDGGSSAVFKFIANTPGDLSSGDLYTLVLDQPLSGGEPTGTTGQWVLVPNTTQSDRNNTRSLAQALGATNFNGVEDCEIHPITGQIYFTAKGLNRTFRFTDNGTSISNFETFVGGTSYPINIGSQIINVDWGGGNDNLVFDDLGNLWVNQDGSQNYIWMVRPDHSQANPKVELFASTPNGSESTGATFTPDFKFMFLSIQHPSGSNGSFQDASGNTFAFDKSTTIVVARKEYLGQYAPQSQSSNLQTQNPANCEQVEVDWTAGNGSRRLVIAKAGAPVDAMPLDGMMYSANATFGNGDDLGNGNFVIYDGTGNSVQVTGIDNSTEYHFAVVEYAEQFGSTFYNTTSPASASFEFDAALSQPISGADSALIGATELYTVTATSGYDYDWNVTGGNILSGQSTASITVEWMSIGNQDVDVMATTDQGCGATDQTFTVEVSDTLTSINELNGKVIYRVYPNPTIGITTIDFEDGMAQEISMMDVNGRPVAISFVPQANTATFDASTLTAGVYFLQMVLETGDIKTQQIVVK